MEYMDVEPDINITGKVTQIDYTASSVAVTVTDVSVETGTKINSYEKILCYLNSEKSKKLSEKSLENIIQSYANKYKIGNVIKVLGKAQAFDMPTNDGQFNAYRYYREKDYAYMVQASETEIIDDSHNMYENIRRFTDNCISVYSRFLSEENAGIISAMVFGRKNLLIEDNREMYAVNGLMHILAVSGMHISVVAMIILVLIIRIPIEYKFGRGLLFCFLLFYGVMTGFGVSCIRAVIMFGVRLLAELTGRTYDALSSMALAAIITLLINPRVLFHCDFLLSYLAVLAISVVYPIFADEFTADKGLRQFLEKMIIKPFLISMCTWIITLPAVLYFYYEVPVYSILVNLVVLPFVTIIFIVSWIMLPLSLCSATLTFFVAGSIDLILGMYRFLCDFCVKYIYDLRLVGFPSALKIVICYLVMILILFLWKRCGGKFRAAIILLFMLGPIIVMSFNVNREFKISFLDVGQGECAILELSDGKVICIDCGSSDVKKLAKNRIEPFLDYNGIRKIDCFVLTHVDSDHYSGLTELLERKKYNGIEIGKIVIADSEVCKDEFNMKFGENFCKNAEFICEGQKIVFGDVVFKCLNPLRNYYYDNQNDSSVVLGMEYGDFNALFMGDVSGKIEKMIIDESKYDLLKVAHHGSKDSSCESFLQSVKPQIAVISCGKNNSYGHPHEEVLERLDDCGTKNLYVTAECGQVKVSCKEGKWKVRVAVLKNVY